MGAWEFGPDAAAQNIGQNVNLTQYVENQKTTLPEEYAISTPLTACVIEACITDSTKSVQTIIESASAADESAAEPLPAAVAEVIERQDQLIADLVKRCRALEEQSAHTSSKLVESQQSAELSRRQCEEVKAQLDTVCISKGRSDTDRIEETQEFCSKLQKQLDSLKSSALPVRCAQEFTVHTDGGAADYPCTAAPTTKVPPAVASKKKTAAEPSKVPKARWARELQEAALQAAAAAASASKLTHRKRSPLRALSPPERPLVKPTARPTKSCAFGSTVSRECCNDEPVIARSHAPKKHGNTTADHTAAVRPRRSSATAAVRLRSPATGRCSASQATGARQSSPGKNVAACSTTRSSLKATGAGGGSASEARTPRLPLGAMRTPRQSTRSLSPSAKRADLTPCSLASLARASNSIVAAPSQAQPQEPVHPQVQMHLQAQEIPERGPDTSRAVSPGRQDDGVMRLGSPLREWHFERVRCLVLKPEASSNAESELLLSQPVKPVARKLRNSVAVPVDVVRSVTPEPPAMLTRAASAGAVVGRPSANIDAVHSVPDEPRTSLGGLGGVPSASLLIRNPNKAPSADINVEPAARKNDVRVVVPQSAHGPLISQWQQGPVIMLPMQSSEPQANREMMPGPLVTGWQQALRFACATAGNLSPRAGAPHTMCKPRFGA
eukprot:gnl/TRDRNA2_/TRDRNA2_38575_c0_seq1.p1 gnl/TRDRNA2_/TRDRNA2_38575_c0~~gnl/TRDRNA2_/TRDRNA2_38575_c0_seq1.p1  ORF type:complete len:670 (+),score=99.79 gnl/TRDRNA2_/TRDRNA2_38575_c0_seq1:79-2088(+)